MRRRMPALQQCLAAAVLCAASATHAASLTVTTTADSGAGSLRQAILDANGNAEPDVITFVGLAGQTIAPLSGLPQLSSSGITLDGDLGGNCTPDINLSGASAGNVAALVIPASATGTTVRGLALHSWNQSAFSMAGPGTVVECNHIGTNTGGTAVLPVGATGGHSVFVSGGSTLTVGPDNLIVNGRGAGVRVTENQTNGYPEFTALTSDATPRVYPEINFSEGCGSFTGSGFTPVDGSGRPFTDNFGMRLRGTLTVGSAGSYTFDFSQLDDNARLRLDGSTTADFGFSLPTTATPNLSAGAHTIEIDFREGSGSSRLVPTISGPGTVALSTDNQALCATGAAGLCAEFFQLRIPASGNRITRNRIRDNAGLGIALASCGPYTNDAGDVDVGPNGLLNTPVILGIASLGGGEFNITGTAPLNSTVELFQAAPDPSGFGEGASFIKMGTASAGGNFTIATPIAASGALTATATDTANNTSEFGKIFPYSTGATRLYAAAQSASSIALTWVDPNFAETGFRVERSTNGTSYVTVTTPDLGPNATSYLDNVGLSAGTLYYYRVVATGGAAPASNRATASTFPASAAKVCFQRFDRIQAFALSPAAAFDGTAWGVAWSERDITRDNIDLLFRRFDATTLAPLGAVVTISDADMNIATPPRMVWNGSNYGVIWSESIRGAAGAPLESPTFFALLDGNGNRIRGNVRIPMPVPNLTFPELIWDGSHWGVFGLTSDDDPLTEDWFSDVFLLRLTADGDATGAPVLLGATSALNEGPVHAAWSPQRGHYGVAFVRGRDADYDVSFQRFSATGTPVDANAVVLDTRNFALGQSGIGSISVTWDGTNWAVAYAMDDPTSTVETAMFLRRIDGTSGLALGTGPVRLSDDGPDASLVTAVLPRSGGGHTVFAQSFLAGGVQEVTRSHTNAVDARDGVRIIVSVNDGQTSARTSVARGGSDYLVVYSHNNSILPNELSAVRIAADGLGAPQAPVQITSGHDPTGGDIPRSILTAPLGSGFVGVWVDGPLNALKINARIWNGAGQVVSTLTPLTAVSTRGVLALTSVGNSFALAWKNATNDVVFARYNTSGGAITSPTTIAAATGTNTNIALGWSGESYGVFWQQQGGPRYVRVDETTGTAIGSPVITARGVDGGPAVQWIGDSWALVTRAGTPDGRMEYVRLAADGALLDGPVALNTPLFPDRAARAQQLHYSGRDLGLAWVDWLGFDPPSEDIYFTVLERDGSKRFPEIAAYGTSVGDNNPRLYSSGANFRLTSNAYGFTNGMHEIEITPAGSVLPGGRYFSNRISAIGGGAATAFNGLTTASFYFASGLQHLYFHTSACLVDATPPPCPALTTSFANGAVQASWNAVNDPESGVIRYLLYRDGGTLAELDADVLTHADGGYSTTSPNIYEVRALNGAFVESASCPTQAADIENIFDDGFED